MDNEYIKPRYCHSNGSVYNRDNVELVVMQTTAGEIGVMSGHIPTSCFKTGFVKVKFHDGTEYIAVRWLC